MRADKTSQDQRRCQVERVARGGLRDCEPSYFDSKVSISTVNDHEPLSKSPSSTSRTMDFDTKRLAALAEEFNLTYTAFDKQVSSEGAPSSGSLTLSAAFTTPLEPAPVTPTTLDSAPWRVLSGTIKTTFNAQRGIKGADNIIVAPGMGTGNTGTFAFSLVSFGCDLCCWRERCLRPLSVPLQGGQVHIVYGVKY